MNTATDIISGIFVFLLFVLALVVFYLIVRKIALWLSKGWFNKIRLEREDSLYKEEVIKEKARLQARKEHNKK